MADTQSAGPQSPACDDKAGKAFAALRARASVIGYTLCTLTETDSVCFYLLSRWGMTRTLPDLASVAVFLRQVGAPQ